MVSDQIISEVSDPRRIIALKRGINVRDLGGYTTADGQRTCWRRFLRSGGMHLLTAADQHELIKYGARTVIDLRMGMEVEKEPNVFAGSTEVSFQHLPFWGDVDKASFVPPTAVYDADTIAELYRQFLSRCQESIGKVMKTLADSGTGAAIYHCAGGKDRTGVTSALLLANAGVSSETIDADYVLTARYKKLPTDSGSLPDPLSDPEAAAKMGCPHGVMLRLLAHLEADHGGAQAYLRKIGLTDNQIQNLRSHLLD